jgi:hypothetical protein
LWNIYNFRCRVFRLVANLNYTKAHYFPDTNLLNAALPTRVCRQLAKQQNGDENFNYAVSARNYM